MGANIWNKESPILNAIFSTKWPKTRHIRTTLNPQWMKEKITLVSADCQVNPQAMLYVLVYDFDFGINNDDFLGALSLNVQELVSMNDELKKETSFNEPLERYGKLVGQIMFNLEIEILMDSEEQNWLSPAML